MRENFDGIQQELLPKLDLLQDRLAQAFYDADGGANGAHTVFVSVSVGYGKGRVVATFQPDERTTFDNQTPRSFDKWPLNTQKKRVAAMQEIAAFVMQRLNDDNLVVWAAVQDSMDSTNRVFNYVAENYVDDQKLLQMKEVVVQDQKRDDESQS